MSPSTIALTAVTMVAFAANSLLCRAALGDGAIDAPTFTAARVASGALALVVLTALLGRSGASTPSPPKARARVGALARPLALLGYALFFSLAYVRLDTATGALILFAGVQLSMIALGVATGERPRPRTWLGALVSAAGLVYLLLPGATAPPPLSAAYMGLAGAAWGVYSHLGRGAPAPLRSTRDAFVLATPLALAALLLGEPAGSTTTGLALAVTSGAVTSGVGYAVWYRALRGHTSTSAAVVQLSVPVIAAGLGVAVLGERATLRLALASAVILGGILLAIWRPRAQAG